MWEGLRRRSTYARSMTDKTPSCVICGRPVDATLVYGHLGWMHEACVPVKVPGAGAAAVDATFTPKEQQWVIAVVFSFLLLSILGALALRGFPSSGSTGKANEAEARRLFEARANAEAARLRNEREAEERRKAAAEAIEAGRSPSERGALAMGALSAASIVGVCRAHQLLDPIPEKERVNDVKAALTTLRQQEAAVLRAPPSRNVAASSAETVPFRRRACARGRGADAACTTAGCGMRAVFDRGDLPALNEARKNSPRWMARCGRGVGHPHRITPMGLRPPDLNGFLSVLPQPRKELVQLKETGPAMVKELIARDSTGALRGVQRLAPARGVRRG